MHLHGKELGLRLEALRQHLGSPVSNWSDRLGVEAAHYQAVIEQKVDLPLDALLTLSESLDAQLDRLLDPTWFPDNNRKVRDAYLKNARSNRRSLLSYFSYIELTYGAELARKAMQRLDLSRAELLKSDQPISLRAFMDLAQYLRQEGLESRDIRAAGRFSLATFRNTAVGETLNGAQSLKEAFECWVDDLLRLYEKNFQYRITRLDAQGGQIISLPLPEAIEQDGTVWIGNADVCLFRQGVIESFPGFFGLPFAQVTHSRCIHRGDLQCVFDFSTEAAPLKKRFVSIV